MVHEMFFGLAGSRPDKAHTRLRVLQVFVVSPPRLELKQQPCFLHDMLPGLTPTMQGCCSIHVTQ